MTEDRWQELTHSLEEKGLLESREHVKVDDVTSLERVIFNSMGTKMKLELTRHPREVSKKTIFTKRFGAPVAVSKVYSEDETILTLKAFRWNNEGEAWEPFDSSSPM